MDTGWLAVFRAVARHGSVTAAAAELRFTQSAVSRQLAALEASVGAQLFDRLPRGVRLTNAGRAYLVHAEAVLDRLDSAARDLTALRTATGGRLRVGAFPTANAALVPRAMGAFRADHPGVELSLVEGTTDRQLPRLTAGDIDVAVVTRYAGEPPDPAVELLHLVDDPFLLALPRTHPLAGRRRIDVRELAGENWIEGRYAGATDQLVATCLRAGFRPRVDLVVGEWTGKQGFVAAGLGVTLVPALAAVAARRDVVLVPLGDQGPVRTVYAALPARGTPAPAVTAFVDHLRGVVTHLRAALRRRGIRIPA